MKKILIFSLQYYPLVGGAEVAIKEITDRIPPSDVEFHMVTLRFNADSPREEKLGNVFVHRIGSGSTYLSKMLFVPLAALAARRLDREHQFDAAWAMMSYMALPIALGWKKPYALTLQDGDPFERVFERWYIKPFLPLLRSGFRNATRVSVLSNYLATWVRRMGYKRDISIIPNGADVEHFANAKPVPFQKEAGDLWLVTSSRLVHKNAIDDVIRALASLPANVKFLVLGTGPEEEKLKALTASLGLGDRVRFLGYVSHAELPGYLHACDIFIRPSRTEGFGASFPEAFAAGIPVIATQEGGIADFLFDEKRNPDTEPTGWAVDKDSPEQIAQAVNDIIAHPEKVARVIANAKELVIEKYDWNLIAKQSEDLFMRTVEAAARKRITLATPLYPPEPGGPATYAKTLVDGFPERGIDIDLIKFSDVRHLPKGVRHIAYAWDVFRSARRADLVLALDPVSTGLPALIGARLAGRPFFVRIAGDYAWEQGVQRAQVIDVLDVFVMRRDYPILVRGLRWLETFVARSAERIIVPSQYLRRIIGAWSIPSESIAVVYNAAPEIGNVSRRRPLEERYFVSVGRLVPWKGMDALIRAIGTLPGEKLVIIGDGPERERLEGIVRNLGLNEEMVIFAGSMPREEVLRYLRHAEAFVLNTRYEGLSHLILEALALHVPVLTTPAGGNVELIENEKTGLLFRYADVQALAAAMTRIRDDEKLARTLTKNGAAFVKDFTKEKVLEGSKSALGL